MICLCWTATLLVAGPSVPSAWQHEQFFSVPAPGLVRLSLPVATLDAARPALEDLRLFDADGNEVPYWLDHPTPPARTVRRPLSFEFRMKPHNSILTVETGVTNAIDGLTLESSDDNFIKSVTIEGAQDYYGTWKMLTEDRPLFRRPFNRGAQMHVSFEPGVWAWLRVTVNDRRAKPVPWTGAMVHLATREEPTEDVSTPATIIARDETGNDTRLTLDLGAANLDIDCIDVETPAALFDRKAVVAIPDVINNVVSEKQLGTYRLFRVHVAGETESKNLSIPVHEQIPSKQLYVLIRNGDSPPLLVSAVRVQRRPVYLLFLAQQAGAYRLMTGNHDCPPPSYDLSALRLNPDSVPVLDIQLSQPMDNTDYRAPEILPGVAASGAPLDVAGWMFRKAVKISRVGGQMLELDPDTLAHSQPGLPDIRLLQDSRQIPFILENTSITRSLPATASVNNDAKDPKITRWTIATPEPGLPLSELTCASPTPLFNRDMTLYQNIEDERGAVHQDVIDRNSWRQFPNNTNREFFMSINRPLQNGEIFLETHNGDNPPIELQNFHFTYLVPRLLFKTGTNTPVFLYYGNPKIPAADYDLSMVAGQLAAAGKNTASLGEEERLKAPEHREHWRGGRGNAVVWGVMALVVIVLLWVIAKLLPKSEPSV